MLQGSLSIGPYSNKTKVVEFYAVHFEKGFF